MKEEQQIKHEPHPIFDNTKILGNFDVVKVETQDQLKNLIDWLNSELNGRWSNSEAASSLANGHHYFNFFLENSHHYFNSWRHVGFFGSARTHFLLYEDLLLDQSKTEQETQKESEMTEDLKDNLCSISFLCMDGINLDECVYRWKQENGQCKHFNDYHCNSSVANVNRMILHSKSLGLDMGVKDDTPSVYSDIKKEVKRAKNLHPNVSLSYSEWLVVLAEEFGEVARDICESIGKDKISENYRTELLHVAAVAVRMIENYDGGKNGIL